jgi:hypothetical protein
MQYRHILIISNVQHVIEMRDYFKRLKEHPGTGVAFAMTLLGFMAGATNKSLPPDQWYIGGFFGAAFAGVLAWGCVLISNIKRK